MCVGERVFVHPYKIHCYISHLSQKHGDYIPDWHMLGFTCIGLLLHWLKTWLLISWQLYQGSNGQTIRLMDRDKGIKRRDTDWDAEDGMAWMILIVMAISAVYLEKLQCKTTKSPSLVYPGTYLQTHVAKLPQEKKIHTFNFAIRTFVIVQKTALLALFTPTTIELHVQCLLFPVLVFKCI